MSITQAEGQKVLILIVEGLGQWDGVDINASIFTSHTLNPTMLAAINTELGATATTAHVAISNYPLVSDVRMKMLDPISSDSGWTMSMSALSGATRLLLDYERGEYVQKSTAAIEPVLVATSISATDTTISVTESGALSVGELIVIDGEAMKVTGAPTATSISVTRGLLGTPATFHRIPQLSFVVWRELPALSGAKIRLYAVSAEDTVLPTTPAYRGRLDSVSSSDGDYLTISVSSLFSQIFKTQFTPELQPALHHRTLPMTGFPEDRLSVDVWAPYIDEGDYYPDLNCITLWLGDKWIVVEASWDAPVSYEIDPTVVPSVFRTAYRLILGDVIAWGEEGGVINVGPIPDDYSGVATFAYGTMLEDPRDMTLEGVLEGLLTGEFPSGLLVPPGTSAGLSADDIGSLDAYPDLIDGDLHNLTAPSLGEILLLAPSRKLTFGEYLSEHILKPFGIGIGIGTDGKVWGVNWGVQLSTDRNVTTDDLASDAYTATMDQASSLLSVSFEAERVTYSSRVSQAYNSGAGMTVSIKPGTLSVPRGGPRKDIASQWKGTLISALELAPRIVQLSLRSSVKPVVGEMVAIDLPRLPTTGGLVDLNIVPPTVRLGRVMGVSRDLASEERRVTISFGRFVSANSGSQWGPAGLVDGAAVAGTLDIKIKLNSFCIESTYYANDTDAFAEDLASSLHVNLYDEFLTRRSDNSPKLGSIPDAVTLRLSSAFSSGGVPIAINDGDVVVLSLYTGQSAPAAELATFHSTWWTDVAGRLNGDEGKIYE